MAFEMYCIFTYRLFPVSVLMSVFQILPSSQANILNIPCLFFWCGIFPDCFPELLRLSISLPVFLRTHFLLKVYSNCLQIISSSLVIILMLPCSSACLYKCNDTWTWPEHNACTWETPLAKITHFVLCVTTAKLPCLPYHHGCVCE